SAAPSLLPVYMAQTAPNQPARGRIAPYRREVSCGCLLVQVRVERERLGEGRDAGAQRLNVGTGQQSQGDDVGDLGELGVTEAAGGERRRADAQTRGDHRRARVVGDRIAVHGDVDLVQQILGLLAV